MDSVEEVGAEVERFVVREVARFQKLVDKESIQESGADFVVDRKMVFVAVLALDSMDILVRLLELLVLLQYLKMKNYIILLKNMGFCNKRNLAEPFKPMPTKFL